MKKVNITNFFQDEQQGYLGYARYVVEHRALPSIVDGLKPGARKVLHAGLKTLNGEQKYLKLIGATLEHSLYAHGDSSLMGTITTLAQHYSDNLAPLDIIGAGPELRSYGSASPRYLAIKLSKYAKLYRQDENILNYKVEDNQSIEPEYYLPLIPMALTKRTSGMGLGYSYSSSISYNVLDIIDACIAHLKGNKTLPTLHPYIKGFTGKYVFEPNNRVWAEATWTHKGSKILVTELIPSMTYEKYEELLDKAKDNGKILDWDNLSEGENILYEIKGNATDLAKLISSKNHWRWLKLGEYLKRPTLTLLNEFGKVSEFESIEHILKYFTDFRLRRYDELKDVKITDLETRIAKTSEILKFIELYLEGKIKLDKNTPLEKTLTVLDKHKLPHKVLDMQIRKLTKEEYDKLTKHKQELEAELKRVLTTTTIDMYLQDLKELRKDMKSDFPTINTYETLEE